MAPDFTFGNALQLCPHAPQADMPPASSAGLKLERDFGD
jgi:hypothetical protein